MFDRSGGRKVEGEVRGVQFYSLVRMPGCKCPPNRLKVAAGPTYCHSWFVVLYNKSISKTRPEDFGGSLTRPVIP